MQKNGAADRFMGIAALRRKSLEISVKNENRVYYPGDIGSDCFRIYLLFDQCGQALWEGDAESHHQRSLAESAV